MFVAWKEIEEKWIWEERFIKYMFQIRKWKEETWNQHSGDKKKKWRNQWKSSRTKSPLGEGKRRIVLNSQFKIWDEKKRLFKKRFRIFMAKKSPVGSK